MVSVIGAASELEYTKVLEGTLIDTNRPKSYPDKKTVIISTGSRDEAMATSSRMAASIHRKTSIKPGDVAIFSSTPIPGNEKAVSKVINELSIEGVGVTSQDTHVSGHACQEEVKLIYSLLRPGYALPVREECRHLMAQKGLAEAAGIPKENVPPASSGDVVEIHNESCKMVDHVQSGAILVDGLGVSDAGDIVLRDRQNLAQNGIITVVLTFEKYNNQLLADPDIVSRGFVCMRESENLMEQVRKIMVEAADDCLERHVSGRGKIKDIIRDSSNDFLRRKMKRNPMILSIIMEAG